MYCRTTMAEQADKEQTNDIRMEQNGNSTNSKRCLNFSSSYLALVPRGLEIDVIGALSSQFHESSKRHTSPTSITHTSTNMFVWNHDVYEAQADIAKSRMREKDLKKRQRELAQRQQKQHKQPQPKPQKEHQQQDTHPENNLTSTSASEVVDATKKKNKRKRNNNDDYKKKNDALASWTPSPSSSSSSPFPVGHVRISPGHHCSIGYYPCYTEEGNLKTRDDEVRYKSIVSTSGVLEGTAWIQIDTTTTTTTTATATATSHAEAKHHHVNTILQKSRCVGPLLALISTQADNRYIPSANSKPGPTINDDGLDNDKYSTHTVSEMVSEIRRHLVNESNVANDTHDSTFRSCWESAFSVWKRWVLGDDENDDNGNDPAPNLWRDRLSPSEYQSLKVRIDTNQLRFRLSCIRQDPPVYPPFLKQHQQQDYQQQEQRLTAQGISGNAMSDNTEATTGNKGIRSEEHDNDNGIIDDGIAHQPNDKVPGQEASRRHRLKKSARRKGTSKEFNYERRDLLQGLMDDPICRQMLVPYYQSKNDINDLSNHSGMQSSSPPTSSKKDVPNLDDHSCGGGWKVDLKNFDIELVMIVVPGSPGRWAFGISLLPYQFCKSKTFGHNVIPPDISSPYYGGVDSSRPSSSAVFDPSVIRLRPSTAQILLSMADLKPGDVVLDPFVGIGTIAVEADRFTSSVIGIGGDLALVDPSFSRSARDLGGNGFLAAWDASCLPCRTASIDVVVSDLPFGQKCLSLNQLNQLMPLVFWQCARALRPSGRMVLLCGSTPVSLISFVEELSGLYFEKPFLRFSPVTIGGLVAWVIHIKRNHTIFDPCEDEKASYKARARKMVGRREQNNRRRHSEYTEQNARQKRRRPILTLHSSVLVPTPGPTPGTTPAPSPDATPAAGSKQKERKSHSPNIVVVSEAGKPIFSRFPITEKFGLLVQALRTSVNRNQFLELGEIQCLESNRKIITFMTVGSITLLSISDRRSIDGTGNAFVYAKYRLEYVYSQLIMSMTDQVQVMFQYNPSLDLQSSFNSNEKILRGMLDDLDAIVSTNNAARYMVAAVSPLFPFPHKLRNKMSKVLQSVCGRPENNVAFALLVAGDKLISMVQPPYLPHQVNASDLHLIVQVIAKQSGLTSSELWMPICLPRFNSSGFLYAYAKCVDDLSNLTVIILSSHGTTEQFQLLRESSLQLQKSLLIPLSIGSVITASSPSSSISKDGNDNKDDSAPSASASASASSRTSSDMDWKRGDESTSFDETIDGDYVNISNDMLNVGKDLSTTASMEDGEVLYHTRQALNESVVEAACAGFLGDDRNSVIHFLFRLDVPIKDSSFDGQHTSFNREGRGCLSQCIALPVTSTLDKEMEINRQRIWSNYQKINLRLRLGSATVESSMDAFDMINKSCQPGGGLQREGGRGVGQQQENGVDDETAFPSISKHCTAMGLIESPPCTVDGITYIIEGDKLYLGMNGKDFELFLVLASNDLDVSIKRGAAIAAKLVRGIMSEEKKVFLSKPLTWRYY